MSHDSLIGKTFGKYNITALLGSGGMAEVYKAYQENLDRHVAIKVMHPHLTNDSNFVTRFQREARAMGGIKHPNIIDVYDFDLEGNRYYIVMEYIEGGTLKERIEGLAQQGQHMSLSEAVRIVLQVADALSYAHSRGMVHRDIKPGNIMLNGRGKAILTDFGIAKVLSEASHTLTATGVMVGTPAYMSPEQGLGEAGDERSDLYALGILFYQMVTGQLPYHAETPIGIIMKHINEPPTVPSALNPAVPVLIERVMLKALEKKPEDRYASVHAFAKALRMGASASLKELDEGLPTEVLVDVPTPVPVPKTLLNQDVVAETAVDLRPQPLPAPVAGPATLVEPSLATVVHTPAQETLGTAKPAEKPARRWLLALGMLLLLGLVGGGILWGSQGTAGEGTPTPLPVAAAVVEATDTPSPTATATLPPSPTATMLPTETPTATPRSTATPRPSRTPTPDPLADCEFGLALVRVDTYQSQNNNVFTPVGVQSMPLTWVLENTGTCAWPADLVWVYAAGEELGGAEGVALPSPVAPGEEIVLSTTLQAPNAPGDYAATWQLVDADGEPFFDLSIEFEISAYIPATATLTPTPTLTPSPTPETVVVEANVQMIHEFANCIYPGGGTEWRCDLRITPYGGAGDEYTVLVFDSEPPARYFQTGTVVHFASARRCSPWIHEVVVQDEASGQRRSFNIFFDPTAVNLFPGGSACTE